MHTMHTFGLLCTTKLSNPLKVVIVDDSDQTAPSWTLSNLHKQASSCGNNNRKISPELSIVFTSRLYMHVDVGPIVHGK